VRVAVEALTKKENPHSFCAWAFRTRTRATQYEAAPDGSCACG
jgi:hypothetical protein